MLVYLPPSNSKAAAAAPETKRKQTRPRPGRRCTPRALLPATATQAPPLVHASLMASSPAQRPLPVLLLLVLLLAAVSSPSVVRAGMERSRAAAPALAPVDVAAGRARQEFHVAPAPEAGPPGAGMSGNGVARRPFKEWRRSGRRGRGRGGGTGAWAFSAMLPRGFVPPSGSSACHNDMPATAADAQFFACGGAGSP